MSMQKLTIQEIFKRIRNGLTVKNDANSGGLPITRIETISNGEIDLRRVGYSGIAEGEKDDWLLEKGDILFSHINSIAHIGKCAIYEGAPKKLIHGMNLLAFRTDSEKLFPKYALYLLRSQTFKNQLAKSIKPAVNQASVTIADINKIEVDIPPLEEQKRIAAILDKADSLRRKRAQAIALADDFLRAVFLEMFGDPVTNPKGWPVYELRDLVEIGDKINYGVVQPGDDVFDDGVPLVRSGDLRDETPDVAKLRYVSQTVDQKHQKSKLKGNEVLIACVGTIGKVGFVTEEMIGWNIARAVARVPIKSGVNREYVYRYLQNPAVQGFFQKETRTVAQPTLNIGLIEKTPIALPPERLQLKYLKKHIKVQYILGLLSKKMYDLDKLAGSLSINMESI